MMPPFDPGPEAPPEWALWLIFGLPVVVLAALWLLGVIRG